MGLVSPLDPTFSPGAFEFRDRDEKGRMNLPAYPLSARKAG
jgi:hypothetical protein